MRKLINEELTSIKQHAITSYLLGRDIEIHHQRKLFPGYMVKLKIHIHSLQFETYLRVGYTTISEEGTLNGEPIDIKRHSIAYSPEKVVMMYLESLIKKYFSERVTVLATGYKKVTKIMRESVTDLKKEKIKHYLEKDIFKVRHTSRNGVKYFIDAKLQVFDFIGTTLRVRADVSRWDNSDDVKLDDDMVRLLLENYIFKFVKKYFSMSLDVVVVR